MNRLNSYEPLVSIVIITYNSAELIIETLISCINQSYQSIEIIISDDSSKDKTVTVVKNWIEDKKFKEVPIKIIESKENTGISENCNRGIMAANGDWIKIIAGDDLLLDDAIKNYINFVSSSDKIEFVHSYVLPFNTPFSLSNLIIKNPGNKFKWLNSDDFTSYHQFLLIVFGRVFINAPTLFYKADSFRHIGGYDARMTLVEDIPFYLTVTSKGKKFYFLDRPTVLYRKHKGSIQRSLSVEMIKKRITQRTIRQNSIIEPNLKSFLRLLSRLHFAINKNYDGKPSLSRQVWNVAIEYTLLFCIRRRLVK